MFAVCWLLMFLHNCNDLKSYNKPVQLIQITNIWLASDLTLIIILSSRFFLSCPSISLRSSFWVFVQIHCLHNEFYLNFYQQQPLLAISWQSRLGAPRQQTKGLKEGHECLSVCLGQACPSWWLRIYMWGSDSVTWTK